MGVRRLFSRGGQNFPGGAKTYYLPKKTPKNILFSSKKSQKHTILASQGGSRAPSCPPHGSLDKFSPESLCFLTEKCQ